MAQATTCSSVGKRSPLPIRHRGAIRVLASASFCSHPDAIKRRQEAEAVRLQRERERAEDQMKQAMGLKWWEGPLPSNMVVVTTPRECEILSRQAYESGRAVVMNFFQEDCYACRTLHGKLKKLAEDHSNVLFLKVNGSIEALHPIFIEHNITKVPYFTVMRNGEVLWQNSASLNPEKLRILRQELMAAARQVSSVAA